MPTAFVALGLLDSAQLFGSFTGLRSLGVTLVSALDLVDPAAGIKRPPIGSWVTAKLARKGGVLDFWFELQPA
jgi:hypothetical protein